MITAVRVPAYRLEEDGKYRILSEHGLASRTLLVDLDAALRPTRVRELETEALRQKHDEARDGLEDPRLFISGGKLMCLWNGLNTGRDNHHQLRRDELWAPDWTSARNTMIVAEIRDDAVRESAVIASPFGNAREKNWMPESPSDSPTFCYRVADDYTLIYSEGDYLSSARATAHSRLTGWSGSSQMLAWRSGRLCVVHKAIRGNPALKHLAPAVYLHKFVFFSEDGRTYESRTFFFQRRGIEFCAGLAEDGESLVLSYGVDDASAHLSRINSDQVQKLLRRI
ncbi:hypothetical protein [Microbacterium thalli]|uniref:Uncharacterized protein n=1 Tax=Microbacterium thalli TaxID=3027921 RepID=A0ABT5SKZ1_9MICO|nr:hypothetical protein [Microbacterium thalli]MDD7963505.1 hypothetical protein [Microbacterium thalli]